ncbi:hypothetical protein BS50DRAFT_626462 [Corynespora cassiicola Philippines]|uniref:Uncharacterized protein n=1 Tax=Corynespora cassiicola Philippines TaxID=1448308 RepID=A0A2T2N398_CORCC|nr:hypothetical protein BS50DRAFT_626462 [Corynespora cassiicola Philippines]
MFAKRTARATIWRLRQYYGKGETEGKEAQESGQLLGKENITNDIHPRTSTPTKPPYSVRNLLLVTVANAVIFFAGMLFQYLIGAPASPRLHILHCGNSTAEARALGCSFDPLAQAWVPEPCLDYATIEYYMSMGTWQPFDDEGSHPINFEAMSERVRPAPPYLSAPVDHAVHCAFWMKRLIQFKDNWEQFGELYTTNPHMDHCFDVVLKSIVGGPSADKDPNIYKWSKNWVELSTCTVSAD